MEKPEFNDFFNALDKAGDRVRSVVYIFVVLNIALLMYVVNVFAYPVQQFLFDDMKLQIQCRYQSEPKKCQIVAPELAHINDAPRLKDQIERDFWNHQLYASYDKSVALRTFKMPILGLETDRDLLWMIFPLIGMVSYFILWSALVQLAQIFRFLLDRNDADATRLRLMQSAVVITAPLSDGAGGEMTRFYRLLWQIVAMVILAIPPIVTMFVIADQTNAIPHFIYRLDGEPFLKDPTGGLWAKLAFEVVLLLLQSGLFIRLAILGLHFGADQGDAERLIADLEGRPLTPPVFRPHNVAAWRTVSRSAPNRRQFRQPRFAFLRNGEPGLQPGRSTLRRRR